MRKLTIYTIASLALLVVQVSVSGQTKDERNSLRGIGPVSVVLNDLPEDIERSGLTRSQIKTDVELRLRKAGITVSDDAAPYVLVGVIVFKTSPARGYAY